MSIDIGEIEPLVAPVLRQHLRRRCRLLAGEHDDLVQQALEDLLRYLVTRLASPPAQAEWAALALTILKRRVADRFRAAATQAARNVEHTEDEALEEISDPGALLDEIVQYRRLLATVLRLLTELPPSDQALLLDEVDPARPSTTAPSTSTERKHLSRLRERLRQQLQQRFGVAPEDYFGR
jgi:DNA-directed RNA polymerase specialized sigma24 family protein